MKDSDVSTANRVGETRNQVSDYSEKGQTRRVASRALQSLYTSLGGENWRRKDGWLCPGSDVTKWHGLTIMEGAVVSLKLINNELEGELPSSMFKLVTLQELNLSYNNGIKGCLPTDIGNMTNLTVLHVYAASLTGLIPKSLSNLCNLEELWLNGNRLQGNIPHSLGKLRSLRELFLNSNELIGPIPESLSSLTKLEILNLGWNFLEGDFPDYLGNMVSLRLLVLDGNLKMSDCPPATHGKEMMKWLSAKRAVAEAAMQRDGQFANHEMEAVVACEGKADLIRGVTRLKVEGEDAPVAKVDVMSRPVSRKKYPEPLPIVFKGCSTSSSLKRGEGLGMRQQRLLVANYMASNSHPNLQEILGGETEPPYTLSSFHEFASVQLLEENIDFFLQVEHFRLAEVGALPVLATNICERFIKPGAKMEVNVSSSVRNETVTNVERHMLKVGQEEIQALQFRNIFDQAQCQVFNMIETDAFPRFMDTIAATLQSFVDRGSTDLTAGELKIVEEYIEWSRTTSYCKPDRKAGKNSQGTMTCV